MSGDSQRNDDPDFLEDDFIVEDLAGKNDDLEQLFDVPEGSAAGAAKKPGTGAAPDSEDVLFTDHTAGLTPTESFQGGNTFAEAAPSGWTGEQLELEQDKPAEPAPAEQLAAAEAAFTDELAELVDKGDDHQDEELGLDSEKELELVDGPSATDGISEIEQSGPFVLDDNEGTWRDQEPASAEDQAETESLPELEELEAAPDQEPDLVLESSADSPPQPVEPEVAEAIWEAVKEPAMAAHADDQAAIEEPGWEALPEANVDQLSEVGEVERADEQSAQPAPDELAGMEGHDIYSDEQAPVLVGPRTKAAGRFGRVAAVAATLTLVSGAAVMVLRPEWLGVKLEPQRVQQVQIERPRIELAVAAPPVVKPPAPQLGQGTPKPDTPKGEPTPTPTPEPTTDPVATVPPVVTPPEVVPTPTTTPTPTNEPVASAPVEPNATVPPTQPVTGWPVAVETPKPSPEARKGKPLVRIGDNTMLGEADAGPGAKAQPVEGMLPGTRAFAQLHNGNYFIGSIKVASREAVTLRVNEGEVTIAAAEIARLTALGSADYEELQKATSGFVRLTNSNRLVGAILSQIADDHIVLEFRSNRVILPRSVIGEVVQGEAEQEVRLDVTREEDDWVRTIAERQLGKATEAPKAAPAPLPAPTPAPAPPSGGRSH